MSISVNPVTFIIRSPEEAYDLFLEFMGNVTRVDDTTVVCKTAASIEAAQRIGTKVPSNA